MVVTNQTGNTIVKKIDVEVIQTIFHFRVSKPPKNTNVSPNSHCLLRLFIYPKANRALIIASSLFSNNCNAGISRNYPDLAEKVIQDFPELKPLLPNITWLTHAGQFSDYLSWAHHSVKEEFNLVCLDFDSSGIATKTNTKSVSFEEVFNLLDGIRLEPAVEVLKQLKHDNGWGGVVDENQVKACMELEQGIILGKKTDGVTPAVGWFCL
jgi:hypothetical protein